MIRVARGGEREGAINAQTNVGMRRVSTTGQRPLSRLLRERALLEVEGAVVVGCVQAALPGRRVVGCTKRITEPASRLALRKEKGASIY